MEETVQNVIKWGPPVSTLHTVCSVPPRVRDPYVIGTLFISLSLTKTDSAESPWLPPLLSDVGPGPLMVTSLWGPSQRERVLPVSRSASRRLALTMQRPKGRRPGDPAKRSLGL